MADRRIRKIRSQALDLDYTITPIEKGASE